MTWRVIWPLFLLFTSWAIPLVGWFAQQISLVAMIVSQFILMLTAILMRPPARDTTLTGLDALMLNLDRLHNNQTPAHGHIVGVMYVDKCPTGAEAANGLKELVANYVRFRSFGIFAASCLDTAYSIKSNIDIANDHVGEWTTASTAEVEQVIEDLANTGLDMALPLWKVDLISNTGDGDSAVVFRINHCLGDGLRLVRAMGSCLQFEDGSRAEVGLLKRMSERKRTAGNKRGAFELVGQVLSDLKTVADLPNLPAETKTCLHQPKQIFASGNRRVIARSTVPFSAVKSIQASCPKGITVNDVVLTAFCSAVRRYMETRNDPAIKDPALLMRAFCAVSLPDNSERKVGDELYNNFVLPSFDLPIAQDNRADRLLMASASMQKLKSSLAGPMTLAINNVLVRLGLEGFIGKTMLDTFGNHSFVYSNVPAFEKPVYIFGTKAKVTAINAYYPNLISQVICMTYVDTLSFSFITDKDVCVDPSMLALYFAEEVTAWAAEVN